MEEKYFILSVLTKDCKNDEMYFNGTINSFLENTEFSQKIPIHIYHNGSYRSPIIESISEFALKSQNALFSFRVGDSYRGTEFGVDTGNEWAGDYKYCLFLEAEWVTITENKNWLIDSLKFMDDNDLDQLLLYPYESDNENIERDDSGFAFLKEFNYTNKPHIRRNKTFFDNGIFPLEQYNGEPKSLKSAWVIPETMINCKVFLDRMETL